MATEQQDKEQPASQKQQVEALAIAGVSEKDICTILGIPVDTLREQYGAEMKRAGVLAQAKVSQTLYKMATSATKPNLAAAVHWLQQQQQRQSIAPMAQPLSTKQLPEWMEIVLRERGAM